MSRSIALALFVLTLVTGFTGFAHANELDGALAPDGQMAAAHQQADAHHKAIVMRNVGIAMSVLGTASIGLGVFEMMRGALCDNCSNRDANTQLGAGIALTAVGSASALAGIPLWGVGQYRASKAERATLQLSAGGAKLTF